MSDILNSSHLLSHLILVSWKEMVMKFIMSNVVIQMVKPAIFLHGGPGGGGSTTVRRFFNPENIILLFLTKEAVEEVNLMAVWNKIQHGILLKI